ncbi:hypothetical protein GQR58_025895 [Nymphon striatum]|nr:hypothetical protein GQR58_025895 [Nymphon striatum]
MTRKWTHPTQWTALCSRHFQDDCYETTELEIFFGYRKKWKSDAVPTIKTVLSEQLPHLPDHFMEIAYETSMTIELELYSYTSSQFYEETKQKLYVKEILDIKAMEEETNAVADNRNSSCYIDPDEDEIFIGPVSNTEISRISECNLEEFASIFSTSSEKPSSKAKTDFSEQESNLKYNEEQLSTEFQSEELSNHVIMNELSSCEDDACNNTSENPHYNSLCDEMCQEDSIKDSLKIEDGDSKNSDSGFIVENEDDGNMSLLCEGMLTTSFETTFQSDSPLYYHLKETNDKFLEEENLNFVEKTNFNNNQSEESSLRDINVTVDNSQPKYFDEIEAILEFQKQMAEEAKVLDENQPCEIVTNHSAVKIVEKSSSVLPDIPATVKASKLPNPIKTTTKIPQFRKTSQIPKPKILNVNNTPKKASKFSSNLNHFSDYKSPVAKYIYENPTPPLIKNFRANGQLNFPKSLAKSKQPRLKTAGNKENLPKSSVKVMKNDEERKLSLKSVLPVTDYKLKKDIHKEVNWDEMTRNNTHQNYNTKQYFPSPTVVKHTGSSKVIKWANHLEIKDNNCSNQSLNASSRNNSSDLHQVSSMDRTIINVHCSARTDTLSNSLGAVVKETKLVRGGDGGGGCMKLKNLLSINNKSLQIKDYVVDESIDILPLTETWLKNNDSNSDFALRDICPNGFSLLHCPRVNRTGGGIGLLFNQSLKIERFYPTSFASFEFMEFMEFLLHGYAFLTCLVVVYRPPPSSVNNSSSSQFFQNFPYLLEILSTSTGKLLIAGDFNFHVDDSKDVNAGRFIDLLDSFNLSILNDLTAATHKNNHVLDLLITGTDESLENSVSIHAMLALPIAKIAVGD